MSDIELYEKNPRLYDKLQGLRPDYVGAMKVFKELAYKYLGDKKDLVVTDFCSGTGKSSKLLAQELSVSEIILIDENQDFLLQARTLFNGKPIQTVHSNILTAKVNAKSDVVVSMFAYHHVPDSKKKKYIEQVLSALKKNGILILGEIYIPNKETTISYYSHLLESISSTTQNDELEKFLRQTAESENYEYKVPREFAHKQLKDAGFTLLEARKIWPTDGKFLEDVGTFVEVWRINIK